ncbi:MAG: hypothetical protein EAX95_06855 [Candidatus Thorarchaeota archaeon]|nr:hypothetical protein [Candidatus Thorarchaeota archaeon]
MIILACAGLTFGKGSASGRTTITRPSDKNVDGFGGTLARDYSYSPSMIGTTSGGFPVSLRQERKKTETHAQSKGEEEDR